MTSREHTVAWLRARKALGIAERRKRVPRQREPRHLEREYAARLLDVVAMVRRAFEPLLAALPEMMADAARERGDSSPALDARARVDAGGSKRIRDAVAAAAERARAAISPAALDDLAERLAGRVATFNREQLSRQIRAALGADVFIADRGLVALVDGFVAENVALIRDIPTKIAGEVEQAVTRAVSSGTAHPTLAAELDKRFAIGRDRARLIARDQVGKLYGQINGQRQTQMGVTRYVWRTVNDERVRELHAERDGETFEWAHPPNDEPGDGHPGQPILCRCYAEPDFTAILEDAS